MPPRYRALDYQELGGLLTRGGTILGTSNRGRFTAKVGHGEAQGLPVALLDETKRGFEALGLHCPGRHRRRRFVEHRPAALRARRPDRRRSQDHRQRPGRNGDDLRVRFRGGLRHRGAGSAAHDGREPRPRDGARGDGPICGVDRHLRRSGRRRRRHPHPGDSVPLRQHLREGRRTRTGGTPLQHRRRRRGGASRGWRFRHQRRPARGSGSSPRWHRCTGGGGDRAAHRQGDARDGPWPSAARRRADQLRPRPLHAVRHDGGRAHRGRTVRPDGHLHWRPASRACRSPRPWASCGEWLWTAHSYAGRGHSGSASEIDRSEVVRRTPAPCVAPMDSSMEGGWRP